MPLSAAAEAVERDPDAPRGMWHVLQKIELCLSSPHPASLFITLSMYWDLFMQPFLCFYDAFSIVGGYLRIFQASRL